VELALLYDVHGNLPALQAVVEDAREDTDMFLLGGDYALFGPFASETVAVLRALPNAIWIRGNVDRWCADQASAPEDELLRGAIADCREALGQAVVDELGALPDQAVIAGTRYCHASPLSDLRSFLPEATDDEDEILAGATERRVVFGHTHIQFRRTRPDGIELLNPGSVGMPMDADTRAAYALVRGDGSVELRRVGYDIESGIAGLRERFGDAPWAQRSVARLRNARP
jgi:predicted phosphodiesterase